MCMKKPGLNFYCITLFPEMIENAFLTSITGRAMDRGLLSLNTISLRAFSQNSYGSVDDYTYGGGAGMLISCEPVWLAYQEALTCMEERTDEETAGDTKEEKKKPRVIYTTPAGKVFNEEMAEELSKEEDLIILCGHYEGIDQRVLDRIVTDNISIGDYVLTGGELPCLVIMDAVSRRIPGVLNNEESKNTESFEDLLLEYPQYTRPSEWKGVKVPEILLSGDHAKVEQWRHHEALESTRKIRPDLYREWLEKRGIY